ncbi:MAG: D-2-hydroxyacid dehydrogenase [Chloroflexi bacterium]|nr:D-2-hydroxyacid dehydrogenase [Chloroflexota bacterium]
MKSVSVLVVSKTHSYKDSLKDIEAVEPGVVAKDAVSLFVQELRRDGVTDPAVARFEGIVKEDLALGLDPNVRGQSLDSLLQEAEVVYGSRMFPRNMMSRSPRLKWIHIGATGIDAYLNSGIFDGRVTVTNSRGVLAIPIAEHVIGFIFTLAKNTPRLCQAKAEKHWERFDAVELTGKTLGVIGMGAIGTELARMAKGVGMKVIATRRSATQREHGLGDVDEVYPRDALREMLGESDFVALALPLTGETQRLVGEDELRAMKTTAYIINVSRGPIIDEPVLIRALQEGWIAGAGLDVFDKEPLPPESELWGLSNVILSPHIAGSSDKRNYHLSRLFGENLKRYVAGEPLLNVVTKEKGY